MAIATQRLQHPMYEIIACYFVAETTPTLGVDHRDVSNVTKAHPLTFHFVAKVRDR